MRDGRPVEAQQIHARVGHYGHIFERWGTFIGLRGQGSTTKEVAQALTSPLLERSGIGGDPFEKTHGKDRGPFRHQRRSKSMSRDSLLRLASPEDRGRNWTEACGRPNDRVVGRGTTMEDSVSQLITRGRESKSRPRYNRETPRSAVQPGVYVCPGGCR